VAQLAALGYSDFPGFGNGMEYIIDIDLLNKKSFRKNQLETGNAT
jgi:hypothetical protein